MVLLVGLWPKPYQKEWLLHAVKLLSSSLKTSKYIVHIHKQNNSFLRKEFEKDEKDKEKTKALPRTEKYAGDDIIKADVPMKKMLIFKRKVSLIIFCVVFLWKLSVCVGNQIKWKWIGWTRFNKGFIMPRKNMCWFKNRICKFFLDDNCSKFLSIATLSECHVHSLTARIS